jgi:large subunit ribosomal protein L3
MANPRKPRKGSMAYWPRVRAKKIYPRIRGWAKGHAGMLGFAGYKVGMTHVVGIDVKKTSLTKNEEVTYPVTVIECPPIRIFAARFYKQTPYGTHVDHDFVFKPSKNLDRAIDLPEKYPEHSELDKEQPDKYHDIAVLVYTMPELAGIGKKKPEVFELKLGGTNAQKLEFIKAHADKEITVDKIFKEAQLVDAHAITTGKGTQGPIKRFRIALKPHKSEKGRRQPGSRGGWSAQQHVMYRTAYSGQMGFHQRLQYNLQVLKIGNKPEEINPKDGYAHYGKVKSTYMLIKGSVPGPKKRMILFTQPLRALKEEPLLSITHVSLQSKQGR